MKHFLLASAACLVLGACSSGTSTSTLTLPQVQAQAAAIRTGIDGDRVVTLRRAGQQVDIPPAEWATLRQMILDGAL